MYEWVVTEGCFKGRSMAGLATWIGFGVCFSKHHSQDSRSTSEHSEFQDESAPFNCNSLMLFL